MQKICASNSAKLLFIVWFTEGETTARTIEGFVLGPKTVVERFNEDFEAFLDAAKDPKQENLRQNCIVNYSYNVKDIALTVEIPHSLLLGPWTEGKTRYLYWLIKSGATLNWLTSTSGEVNLACNCFIMIIN